MLAVVLKLILIFIFLTSTGIYLLFRPTYFQSVHF
jgi:hypothetical protein